MKTKIVLEKVESLVNDEIWYSITVNGSYVEKSITKDLEEAKKRFNKIEENLLKSRGELNIYGIVMEKELEFKKDENKK